MIRLYVAEGQTRTLLGRREPAATGPTVELELGAITIVRPRPDHAGLLPVRFGMPRRAVWRLFGRSPADYRIIGDPIDRADLRRALDAVVLTVDSWPGLRQFVAMEDPSPALGDALWDLAGVLADRGAARYHLARAAEVQRDLPGGSPMRQDIADRVESGMAAMAGFDEVVAGRLHHLGRLADETEIFLREQQALAEARAIIAESGSVHLETPDGTADVADHAIAVLAAYRELTR